MKRFILGFFAIFGFVFVCLIGGGIYVASSGTHPKLDIPDATLLTLSLTGDLPDYIGEQSLISSLVQPGFSLYDLVSTLDHAGQDDRIKGLLIRVDQSSLGLSKIQELHQALRRFKKAGKFVIAHVDTFGDISNATGQYYTAAIAHEIAMQPYGSVYLEGIGIDVPHIKKFLDDLKVAGRFYKRDEYKAAFDTFTEEKITPANREALTSLFRSLFDQIIRDIAMERDLAESDVRALVEQSPVHGAKKALSLGLIDHIYYYDQCLTYALIKSGEDSQALSLEHYSRLKSNTKEQHPNTIALLFGVGDILRQPKPSGLSMMGGHTDFTAGDFAKNVEQILKSQNIKAVVIRINSPGGSPTASESMWRQIQRLQEKGIKVVVSMGDYCASGGYWLASGADAIVAHPASITGSIGAIGGKFIIQGLLESLNISVDPIRFGQKSLSTSMYRDFSPEEWKSHTDAIDLTYNAFLIRVSEGRKMDLDHVEALAKGRPWTGEDALRLGLVDELGDMAQAITVAKRLAKLAENDAVNIIPYPQSQGPFAKFLHLVKGDTSLDDLDQTSLGSWINPLLTFMKTLSQSDSGVVTRLDIKIKS